MAKKYRSKDILEELEEKKENPVIPIVIFIVIVIAIAVGSIFVYNALFKENTIEIPWIKNDNKPTTSGKPSREQMELLVPKMSDNGNTISIDSGQIILKDIKADSNGFLVTAELVSFEEFFTFETTHILVDDLYTTTSFAVSDRYDSEYNAHDQIGTPFTFRLKKTELDELDVFGFNRLRIFGNMETPNKKEKNISFDYVFYNDIQIINERKNLLQIDTVNELVISYYKVVDSLDATYIYFDFNNKKTNKKFKLNVKKLIINNELYDMSDFNETVYQGAQQSIYIRIPKDDISMVNTMKVSFILSEVDLDNKVVAVDISDEYSKVF